MVNTKDGCMLKLMICGNIPNRRTTKITKGIGSLSNTTAAKKAKKKAEPGNVVSKKKGSVAAYLRSLPTTLPEERTRLEQKKIEKCRPFCRYTQLFHFVT